MNNHLQVKDLKHVGDKAFRCEDYTEAFRAYTEALEIDENNTDVISARAATCIQLQNYMAAQKDAEKLLNLNQEYAQV